MNTDTNVHKPSAKERFWEEMRKFGLISAYLWVCFGALELYKSSILAEHGTSYLPYGSALIKALVIGKFLLIGDAIKVGARATGPTLLHRIGMKSVAFLVMLIIFNILEEIIVGWFHDQTLAASLGEYFGRAPVEIVAPILVMLLILIPLIAATELRKAIGTEQFKAHFLGGQD